MSGHPHWSNVLGQPCKELCTCLVINDDQWRNPFARLIDVLCSNRRSDNEEIKTFFHLFLSWVIIYSVCFVDSISPVTSVTVNPQNRKSHLIQSKDDLLDAFQTCKGRQVTGLWYMTKLKTVCGYVSLWIIIVDIITKCNIYSRPSKTHRGWLKGTDIAFAIGSQCRRW